VDNNNNKSKEKEEDENTEEKSQEEEHQSVAETQMQAQVQAQAQAVLDRVVELAGMHEWKWLDNLFEEIQPVVAGVSEQIINNSKFLKDSHVTLNISPMSSPAAPSSTTTTISPSPSLDLSSSSSSVNTFAKFSSTSLSSPMATVYGSPLLVSASPVMSTSTFLSPAGGVTVTHHGTDGGGKFMGWQISGGGGDNKFVPAWKQRAEMVRRELASAASLKAKLMDVEAQAQDRLYKLMQQENEIKEHLSRIRVLQLQTSALQKKETELVEQMEKQTAKYLSQEKMYEEALESIQKDNEALAATIRSLRLESKRLEELLREAEAKKADMPALELVSGEIKALKSALLFLRRQNTLLRSQAASYHLSRALPTGLTEKERLMAMHGLGWGGSGSGSARHLLMPSLQQEQDQAPPASPHVSPALGPSSKALESSSRGTIGELQRTYQTTRRLLKQVKQYKANTKVLDLTRAADVSQDWARQQLETARLSRRCEESKAKLQKLLIQAQPDHKAHADFATFPSDQMVDQLQHLKPALVGKLSFLGLKEEEREDTKLKIKTNNNNNNNIGNNNNDNNSNIGNIAEEMKVLLAGLRQKDRTKVVLGKDQLRKIHNSLIL
jgi:hypothetical protein